MQMPADDATSFSTILCYQKSMNITNTPKNTCFNCDGYEYARRQSNEGEYIPGIIVAVSFIAASVAGH
jgi:hypothetical protein